MPKAKKLRDASKEPGSVAAKKLAAKQQKKAPKIFASKNPVSLNEWLKGKNSPEE
jgi:hypothetical protein